MADITEVLKTDIKHKKDFVRKPNTGDLDTISGIENLREAVLRRIKTSPGSIVHRPDYGVGLKNFQNAPLTNGTKVALANLINDQLLQEKRILEVLGVGFEENDSEPEKTKLIVRVLADGFDEPIISEIAFGEVF